MFYSGVSCRKRHILSLHELFTDRLGNAHLKREFIRQRMRQLDWNLDTVRKGAVANKCYAVTDAVTVDARSLPPNIASPFETKLLLLAVDDAHGDGDILIIHFLC